MAVVSSETQMVLPSTEEEQSGPDILGFIRRRKGFVILFTVFGTGLGYMALQRETPIYRSSVQVQVIHRSGDSRVRSLMAEKDLSDAQHVVRSEKVLKQAYTNHSLNTKSTLSGRSEDEAVNTMAGMIDLTPNSASVVTISVDGKNPEDIRDIANAIAEEYVAIQRLNYKDASEELRRILEQARDDLHTQLTKAEEEYARFRESSKLTTDGENPHRNQARLADEQVTRYTLEKAELEAEITALEDSLARGGEKEAILLLLGRGGAVEGVGTPDRQIRQTDPISNALLPLVLQEAELKTTVGPGHPKLRMLQERMDIIRRTMMAASVGEEGEEFEAPREDFLSLYLRSLRSQLQIVNEKQRQIQTLASSADALARQMMLEEIEDSNKKAEMERLGALFSETTLSIKEVQVNSGMGGVTANILRRAQTGNKISPVMERFLTMGALLGAFVGGGIGYLLELADRSFRKPEDIIREFGVPIMGHIPFMTEQRLKAKSELSQFDRSAISIHLPRSRPAEAFRSVRTAVCFSAAAGEHRVISVTSPAAGDGKSTLALNLAVSLAQSGKKTVLLESDLRRPKVHKLTGASNQLGLVDVLRGQAEIDDVVQSCEVQELELITCGSRPKDPAELLAKPSYEAFLEELRRRYDYVIVDTPPILAVTDPAGVAARVDGVMVCMRLSRHTRDLGRRTMDALRDIGATVSGIVINGVEERDSYGYGNYRYSDYRYYYKNYNYKYGYGYGRYGRYNSYGSAYGGNEYFEEQGPGSAALMSGPAPEDAASSEPAPGD